MNAATLVIGAGVSGLACARGLSLAGAEVRVVDKSRGVGGRCATRRIDGQSVDHGAAFYHGDDRVFLAALDQTPDADPIEGWPRVVVGEGSPCQPRSLRPGERRLAFGRGMTAFPKHLASGLDIDLETHVRRLDVERDGRVRALTEDGREYRAGTVCVALPAPQALDLVRTLASPERPVVALLDLLAGASSVRCLTVAAGYPASLSGPPWEMAYPEDSRILQTVSHDSSKRRSPRWTVIVLQGLPCWSHRNWERPEEAWRDEMLAEAARLYGGWIGRPGWAQAHRWRFARIGGGGDLSGPLLASLSRGSRIAVCGEAFAWGGGVQAAWRSGRLLARRLMGEDA